MLPVFWTIMGRRWIAYGAIAGAAGAYAVALVAVCVTLMGGRELRQINREDSVILPTVALSSREYCEESHGVIPRTLADRAQQREWQRMVACVNKEALKKVLSESYFICTKGHYEYGVVWSWRKEATVAGVVYGDARIGALTITNVE